MNKNNLKKIVGNDLTNYLVRNFNPDLIVPILKLKFGKLKQLLNSELNKTDSGQDAPIKFDTFK